MPTITWIQERGEERFEQPLNIVLTSTRGCPFCPRFFESPDAQETSRLLVHHIGRDHPLQRPIIAVGNQILGPNATITLLPKPDDIAIENTTSIQVEVDGDRRRTVTATEVATLLSQRTRRFLRLWLRNARAEDDSGTTADFRITIDVAEPEALETVDDAFWRHLTRGSLSVDDIKLFSDDTDGLANRYRDGIASYFLGVLAKDGTTVANDKQRLQKALDHFGAAAHHLEPFRGRAVGSAVATCARFNLNDFRALTVRTGVTDVDVVTRFLVDLSRGFGGTPFPPKPTDTPNRKRFLVDSSTFSLLELVFALATDGHSSRIDNQVERIEHEKLSNYDRAKLAVVVGEWAHRNGLHQIASRYATILYNDPVFAMTIMGWKTV